MSVCVYIIFLSDDEFTNYFISKTVYINNAEIVTIPKKQIKTFEYKKKDLEKNGFLVSVKINLNEYLETGGFSGIDINRDTDYDILLKNNSIKIYNETFSQ